MDISSITDIGKKRKDNQDNYWVAVLDINGFEASVVCLCDGMGGLSRGGEASSKVVSSVKEYFLNNIDLNRLKYALYDINKSLYLDSKDKGDTIGTTCTILLCYKGSYNVLHVGDSRCYKYTKGDLIKVTEDHTIIEKYKKEGRPLPKSLERKYKNILTRCIGVKESVVLDEYEGTYVEGDVFLVCSDGFWHYLKKSDFSDGSLEDLKALVNRFIDSGETDNITACFVKV